MAVNASASNRLNSVQVVHLTMTGGPLARSAPDTENVDVADDVHHTRMTRPAGLSIERSKSTRPAKKRKTSTLSRAGTASTAADETKLAYLGRGTPAHERACVVGLAAVAGYRRVHCCISVAARAHNIKLRVSS